MFDNVGWTIITVRLYLIVLFKMTKSLSELQKLQRTQLTRLTKEDSIDSILAEPEREDGLVQVLMDKMTALVTEVTELKKVVISPDSAINKKFTALQAQVDKQAEIIVKQQRFLETLDRKEREMNLVITGVPDEHERLEGEPTDGSKLNKIWWKAGVRDEVKSHRRLGNHNGGDRRRPILVTVTNKQVRDNILEKARLLKEAGGEYAKIYIKKDVHPSIRKEWKRLHDAEKAEKERPENTGCVIHFNTRERKIYRVIDAWNPEFL